MITITNDFVHLATKNNSYLLHINKYGDLENLHYGCKINSADFHLLLRRRSFIVNTLFAKDDMTYCIDGINFEYSFPFRGDSGSCACHVADDECGMADFVVSKVFKAPQTEQDMPVPSGGESVCIELADKIRDGLTLQLWYVVYEELDVICRYVKIINKTEMDVKLSKVMSAQYDMPKGDKKAVIFDGAWGRERAKKVVPIIGAIAAGSFSGMSSAECSPFFMVEDASATQCSGNVYCFNLMYSGSHEISVECTPYDSIRVLHGVQSDAFNYVVNSGESFVTPVSVSTFSDKGEGTASVNMQKFAGDIVIPKKHIPIMLNSWESVYFDLNEAKLQEFAAKAKSLGFDGVVVDDGWFIGRDDDTTSLGDWFEDRRKFPHGIKAYADYLHSMDMAFGIWIEPEMVSERSQLYKAHPDWALKCKNAREIVGRNQLILDLTKPEVADYVYEALQRLVTEYGADYIKWDFNRRFADVPRGEGSEYFYKYYRALYQILRKFTANYPDVILENCASGGGRFDLGMMSYAPIGWVSDNTDPLSRAEIQQGTSYGFPIRAMLNHISASPSHQTKRATNFDARKNTAFIGSFGAQYDVTKISDSECEQIKNAICEYKALQPIIQNASLYRLSDNENYVVWQVDSGDVGLVYIMQKRFYTVSSLPGIRLIHLDENATYMLQFDNFKFEASGLTLQNYGVPLPMNYQGCGDGAINLTDMSTILIKFQKI